MTEPLKRFKPDTKMVPVPSRSIIPERDVNHSPVLEASHLGIEFGGLKAVDDVNLAIGRTEICGLIGPNGAGKTTVFNLLTKVYQPTTGTVLINGKDTAGMNTVQASKLGIARTFQNIRLFDNMTVEENVRIGLHNQIKYGMFSGIFRLPPLRRTAALGDCARTGDESVASAAGRTRRGHESARNGGADGEHHQNPRPVPDCYPAH